MFADFLIAVLLICSITATIQFLVDMFCFSDKFNKLSSIKELRKKYSAIVMSKVLKINVEKKE